MKKKLLFPILLAFLTSCQTGGNTHDFTSDPLPSLPDSSPVVSLPESETPAPSPSLPAVGPDLTKAIAALGETYVIHYQNNNISAGEGDDSMIYISEKSIYVQYDSSTTDINQYYDYWYIETTAQPGVLTPCYYDGAWYDSLEDAKPLEEFTSSIHSFNITGFSYNEIEKVFIYEGDNILNRVEMLATFNKKNLFLNIDFSRITLSLSEDETILQEIRIQGVNPDKEDVTISLTFSSFTSLPFGLSDELPIEAL